MKVASKQLSLDLKCQIHESQAFVESTNRISLTQFDALKMSNKHMASVYIYILYKSFNIQSVNSTSNFLYTRSDSSGV